VLWDYYKDDWSSLMIATYKGKYHKMQELLDGNCDINYKTKDSLSVLEVAIRNQDNKALSILLKTNKVQKKQNADAIITASCYDNIDIVKQLMNYGYSVNDTLKHGYSALMGACSFGSIKMVDFLIKNGANLNQQRKDGGMTALMLAVYGNKLEKIELLIKNGADKNIMDGNNKRAYDFIDDNEMSKSRRKRLMELLK
jgi:ankyrin